MKDLQSNFIHNLKEARKRSGISQAKLSELVNKSLGFIGDIESGKSFPSLKTLEDLAIALGIQPFELLLPADQTSYEQGSMQHLISDIEQILIRYQNIGKLGKNF